MALRMTAGSNRIFDTCTEESLSAKNTYLVALAALLTGGSQTSLSGMLKFGEVVGATTEEIQRVVCMSACTVGPEMIKGRVTEFDVNQQRPEESLDRKTTHLVGLAACLAAGCACAEGHIAAGRNAGATEEELARCACITAHVAGHVNKYRFLEALQNVEGCTEPVVEGMLTTNP